MAAATLASRGLKAALVDPDLVVVDGLPGSALDPSASGVGTTSRMGLDATRGADFHGVRAQISPQAMQRAAQILSR